MSIRFQIASTLVKASGMKKLFALPQEELLEKARKMNRKRDFQIPTRKQFRYTEKTILGQYSCLKIETQPTSSKRVLLFFFGGGYIIALSPGSIPFSDEERRKMAELSVKDVMLDAAFMATIREIMEHGAPCAFHIGQGLCHCYPAASFCPEGKQAQEEIFGLLQKGVSV